MRKTDKVTLCVSLSTYFINLVFPMKKGKGRKKQILTFLLYSLFTDLWVYLMICEICEINKSSSQLFLSHSRNICLYFSNLQNYILMLINEIILPLFICLRLFKLKIINVLCCHNIFTFLVQVVIFYTFSFSLVFLKQ